MSRRYQEIEVEFRKQATSKYPDIRGIVLSYYGGDVEDAVSDMRAQFNLDCKWELVRVETGK